MKFENGCFLPKLSYIELVETIAFTFNPDFQIYFIQLFSLMSESDI